MQDIQRPAGGAGTTGQDRRVTLTVAGMMFMLLLDGTILNTSLPSMAIALHVPPLALSAAVTIYLLTGAAVLPVAGWLGDRLGLRPVFMASVALFTIASMLCGLAQDATQLVVARALQGLGAGVMMPVGRTIALQPARKDEIISVTALLTWPALFAPVLGPPLGGLITTYGSWRWNFFLNLPIGALAIFLIARWVRPAGPPAPRPLDWAGALGSALGLVLLIGGLEWLAHDLAASRVPAALLVAGGIACLVATVRHLRRTAHPVISLAPFSHRTFAVATAAGGTFAAMCLQATPFLLPLLFQLGLGRNAADAGALLLPYFLGNLAMKTVTTRILVRFGFRRVMVVFGLLNAMAIMAFSLLDLQTSWLAMVMLLVAAGCVRSMLLTTTNTLAFADVPQAQRAAASALGAVSMQVASAMGVAVGAMLLGISQGLHGGAPLALRDFRVAFLAMGVICALTVIQFARLPPEAGSEVTGAARG